MRMVPPLPTATKRRLPLVTAFKSTVTPDEGILVAASRTIPTMSALESPFEGLPQIAWRSRDADGIASSVSTDFWPATFIPFSGASTPSESSIG